MALPTYMVVGDGFLATAALSAVERSGCRVVFRMLDGKEVERVYQTESAAASAYDAYKVTFGAVEADSGMELISVDPQMMWEREVKTITVRVRMDGFDAGKVYVVEMQGMISCYGTLTPGSVSDGVSDFSVSTTGLLEYGYSGPTGESLADKALVDGAVWLFRLRVHEKDTAEGVALRSTNWLFANENYAFSVVADAKGT